MTAKEYKTIKRFLTNLLYKADGSRTKFARKYNIKNYKDFEAVFKDVKRKLKSDREGMAFAIITDMMKTYVGKIMKSAPGNNIEEKTFNSWIIGLNRVALVLDNLKVLKKALEQMEEEGSNKEDIGRT